MSALLPVFHPTVEKNVQDFVETVKRESPFVLDRVSETALVRIASFIEEKIARITPERSFKFRNMKLEKGVPTCTIEHDSETHHTYVTFEKISAMHGDECPPRVRLSFLYDPKKPVILSAVVWSRIPWVKERLQMLKGIRKAQSLLGAHVSKELSKEMECEMSLRGQVHNIPRNALNPAPPSLTEEGVRELVRRMRKAGFVDQDKVSELAVRDMVDFIGKIITKKVKHETAQITVVGSAEGLRCCTVAYDPATRTVSIDFQKRKINRTISSESFL
jgi:hypothetical protein